jgi:hypothetical protein
MGFLNKDGTATVNFRFSNKIHDKKEVFTEGSFSYKIDNDSLLRQRLQLVKNDEDLKIDMPAVVMLLTKTIHKNIRFYLTTISLQSLMTYTENEFSERIMKQLSTLKVLEGSGIKIIDFAIISCYPSGAACVKYEEEKQQREFDEIW